jgi:hypothetical protein
MATASLAEPEPEISAPRTERRDLTTRALRSAVAAWFSLHPARLGALDGDTVERMALRLEGRTLRRTLEVSDVRAASSCGHPWAG